jgi:hypothetical protein
METFIQSRDKRVKFCGKYWIQKGKMIYSGHKSFLVDELSHNSVQAGQFGRVERNAAPGTQFPELCR